MTETITKEAGGEVGEFIEENAGKEILCFGVCNKKQVMDKFKAYDHDGGMRDKDGKRWWVYFECPKCKYGHAAHKMKFFLERK